MRPDGARRRPIPIPNRTSTLKNPTRGSGIVEVTGCGFARIRVSSGSQSLKDDEESREKGFRGYGCCAASVQRCGAPDCKLQWDYACDTLPTDPNIHHVKRARSGLALQSRDRGDFALWRKADDLGGIFSINGQRAVSPERRSWALFRRICRRLSGGGPDAILPDYNETQWHLNTARSLNLRRYIEDNPDKTHWVKADHVIRCMTKIISYDKENDGVCGFAEKLEEVVGYQVFESLDYLTGAWNNGQRAEQAALPST
ncbi:hypothetical protein DL769_010815 [Monosporascus sp. CRB-8-3]|nr:hypothetical protein DL769_010815 [Monosporascus sp. CRB-8-3]